jgi:hypothetical protein
MLYFINFQNLPNTVEELVKFDESTNDDIIYFLKDISEQIKYYSEYHKKDQPQIYDYGALMNKIECLCKTIEKNEFVCKIPEELALFIKWQKCR